MKKFTFIIFTTLLLALISSCAGAEDLDRYCLASSKPYHGQTVNVLSGSVVIGSNFKLVVGDFTSSIDYNSNTAGEIGSISIMPLKNCSLCSDNLDPNDPVVSFYQKKYDIIKINSGALNILRMELKIKRDDTTNVIAFIYDNKNAIYVNNSNENLWCELVSSWAPHDDRLKEIKKSIHIGID